MTRGAHYKALNILGRAEKTRHVLQGYCKREYEKRGNHEHKALADAVHGLFKAYRSAGYEIDEGKEQSNECAPRQTDGRIGARERLDKTYTVKEAADIDDADNAHYDKENYGEYQVNNCSLFRAFFGFKCGLYLAHSKQIALFHCVALVYEHGAVVDIHKRHGNKENQRQQRIKVVGDGSHKESQTVGSFNHTRNRRRPA